MFFQFNQFSYTCLLFMVSFVFVACDQPGIIDESDAEFDTSSTEQSVVLTENDPAKVSSPIVAAARSQVGKTLGYDPAYVGLDYPGGDVPIETGVCTDVIVRALREAFDMDLQKLVHEDMKDSFSEYPTKWGLKKPDRNIDHRRVQNLQKYFERSGYSVEISKEAGNFLPGDIVSCTVGKSMGHIMIVSDRKSSEGVPFVIHNIGGGAREEDRLFEFSLTGHYRVK